MHGCFVIQTNAASPPLYPEEFNAAAQAILNQDLHLNKRDITPDNSKFLYLHLLSKFL